MEVELLNEIIDFEEPADSQDFNLSRGLENELRFL